MQEKNIPNSVGAASWPCIVLCALCIEFCLDFNIYVATEFILWLASV